MKKIYSNRSKNLLTWLLVLFSIAYAVIGCVIVVVIIKTIINSTEPSARMMLMFVPVPILLIVWSLDLILWQITGKETVEITKEGLKVSHSGRVFRYRRFVPITSIKKITNECNQSDVMRDFWVPQWQPKIKVSYNYNDSIRIGRNLSEAECSELLRELQECYPGLRIEAEPTPHKLTLNEILFIIWLVGSIFVFIPAWFVVPILQEKHEKEKIEKYTERMAFIRQNYQKMYCYSTEYGECCRRVTLLDRKDSIYACNIDAFNHLKDSLSHFSVESYSLVDIMPSNVQLSASNIFRGVVYIVAEDDKMSLIYTNDHMFDPVFVMNRYLHKNPPIFSFSDDLDVLRWDETDEFIKNGSLWRLEIE